MSELSTKTALEPSESLGGFETETPVGHASVEVTGTATKSARIDIRIENGRHWVFGVNDETAVLVLALNQNGQRVDNDLPNWVGSLIRRTGLEEVEKA